MVEFTDNQITIIVLVAMGIVAIALVLMFWIGRKYPSKKAKQDPIYKAVTVWLILMLVYGLFFVIGARDREDVKKDLKWMVIAGVILILYYAIASYFINRPIESFKLYEQYVLTDVKKQWNAEPYAGSGYFMGLVLSMVIEPNKNKQVQMMLAESGGVSDKVEVFYGQAMLGNVFPFLSVRNKYTGERLMLAKPPILTTALLHKFLGEEIVSSFAPYINQYDSAPEGIQQPQQVTEVRK